MEWARIRGLFFCPSHTHSPAALWQEDGYLATQELDKDNFKQTVEGNDIVIVDFWAPWCGPCQSFGPVYEDVSEKYQDIVFAKVNTEAEQDLAGAFQVRSIPTLMIFRQQIIIYSQPGALSGSALEDIIRKAQELDMDGVRQEIEEQDDK